MARGSGLGARDSTGARDSAAARGSIQLHRLYAILDVDAVGARGWQPLDVARAFFDGGVRLLQVRAKALSGAALLELTSEIVTRGRLYGAKIVVNDRADIARLSRADGVHVGQDDLDPAAVRAIVGAEALVGRSTHTEAQLDAAEREPIDYVAIGPVFATATKATGYEAVGLDMVRRATRSGRPVVAIGGITLDLAPSVIAAGAASVAVIGDLLATGDPASRAREFLDALRDL